MGSPKQQKPRPFHSTFLASFAGALTALFIYTPFVPHDNLPVSEFHVSKNQFPQQQTHQGQPAGTRTSTVHISSLKATSGKFCDGAATCIFDLGFNTGQDTDLYLKNPNARIVAVEANPVLVDNASAKQPFKSAIASGRLKVLSVGISERPDQGKLTFWINDFSEYSSFIEEVGCRKVNHGLMPKDDHTYCRRTTVPTMTCPQLLETYGSPTYMKIDIEGLQMACVKSLKQVDVKDRPPYISTEGADLNGVKLYRGLGYEWFKVVNQKHLQEEKLLPGSSGPWGDSAEDIFIGKRWQSVEEILRNLPLNKTMAARGWFDLHAKKEIV